MTMHDLGKAPLVAASAMALLFASMAAGAGEGSDHKNLSAAVAQPAAVEKHMKFPVPESLAEEHAQLHAELEQAVQSGGETGKAAQAVATALQEHFAKEEEYALPPLALLPALAKGEVTPEMSAILPLTEELRHNLPQMLIEHEQIQAALARLDAAAKSEHKPQAERFAQELMHHAHSEEQITYPAALLVGEYLQLRLQSEHPAAAGPANK